MIYPSNLALGLRNSGNDFLTLPNTFGTVESVIGEGLQVNVALDLFFEGQTILSNIPLIKLPYLNIPVRKGDKVFLTKSNHLLNEYFLTEEFTQYVPDDDYVAIQCVLKPVFEKNEFTNHFILINPEKSFRWLLNDKESIVEGEKIDEVKTLKSSAQTYKENVSIKIEDSLKTEVANTLGIECDVSKLTAKSKTTSESQKIDVKATAELKLNAPSIDLGSDGVKLGSLIQQLCEALASSQCIVTSGSSAGSYASLSNSGQISAIGAQISSVFK